MPCIGLVLILSPLPAHKLQRPSVPVQGLALVGQTCPRLHACSKQVGLGQPILHAFGLTEEFAGAHVTAEGKSRRRHVSTPLKKMKPVNS